MVCPLCGKKSEVGMFCQECYLKKHLKIGVPTLINIDYCSRCNKYLISGKWVRDLEEEDAVRGAVEKNLKTNMKGVEKSGLIEIELEKRETEYHARIWLNIEGSNVEKRTIVRIKRVTCMECSMLAGGYYEAVIQLRGKVGKKEIEEINKQVEEQGDKFAFISEVKRVQGGYDINVGSKKAAEKVVNGFRGKAEMKKSFVQVGYDSAKGKPKNRFFYLVRLEGTED